MIDSYIKALADYAENTGLSGKDDRVYCINCVLSLLKKSDFDESCSPAAGELHELLEKLCDYAVDNGIIEDSVNDRDLFDTAIMGAFIARPSEIRKQFAELYSESPEKATVWYYKFSNDTNYIRRDRIAKMLKWQYDDEKYGTIDITVNLSKPEKDPKSIAAAKNAPQSGYPKCNLCKESEGYAGTATFPARQNHRIIPVKIDGDDWFFQYSPYVYYNEHCIVFNSAHSPMKIDRSAFVKLLDFITAFPHYFVGSNADLPIVGGSILSHEHFQGGRYEFAMERAPIIKELYFKGFDNVKAGIVKWPLSTIRLLSSDKTALADLADKILTAWRRYTDASAFIFAETEGVPHNTITPIARRRGEKYELDLVLRNNITTDEHPLGVYHPHSELHHIKKENIGLIEVMGLAVLPPRLKPELKAVSDALLSGADMTKDPLTASHAGWAEGIKTKYKDINKDNVDKIIKDEVGKVFSTVLEHAGVFKAEENGQKAFMRFIDYVD